MCPEPMDVDVPGDEQPATGDNVSERTSLSIDTYLGRHVFEGGRRYHAFRQGRYHLPNDDIEQQREELLHILVLDVMDEELFFAPIAQGPIKVMDIGTGIGLWAIEMGDRFPEATVLGLDLSPIQPRLVPPNVTFEVDDIEDDWVHDTDYDFVHMRECCSFLHRTPFVFEQAFQHIKPGGWFETQDFHYETYSDDGTMPEDCPMNTFLYRGFEYGRLLGRELVSQDNIPKLDVLMREAGFVNVRKKTIKVPYGSWPKEENLRRWGVYLRATMENLLPQTVKIFSTLGMTPAEIQVMFADIAQMLRDDTVHCYTNYCIYWGQKPYSS